MMAYEYELDEWRALTRSMSETERFSGCGHSSRTAAVCPDCNHDARSEV